MPDVKSIQKSLIKSRKDLQGVEIEDALVGLREAQSIAKFGFDTAALRDEK